MKFSDIAGQGETINRIIQNVRKGRVSHAQMIIGPEGSGTLALALAYAQFINCTDKQYIDSPDGLTGDSCGTCPSCLKSRKLIHPDIHFVVPVNETKQIKKRITREFLPQWRQFLAERSPYTNLNQWYEFIEMEKQGLITAEECNEMLNTLNYKTYESEYKVMIVWMIEKLFYAAAPKILKILEEPPEKTLFLLVSDNPQQVLDTIMSRVQLIKLRKPSTREIADHLVSLFGMDQPKAVRLSDRYDRNMAAIFEAIQNEDSASGYMEKFTEWMRICFRMNTKQILSAANDFRNLGREKQKQFLSFATIQMRNSWVNHFSGQLMHQHDPQLETFYANFGKYLNESNIQLICKELEDAIYAVERNANQRILFTDVSLKIGGFLKHK
jgi:DNA polymerase III subunit delta'